MFSALSGSLSLHTPSPVERSGSTLAAWQLCALTSMFFPSSSSSICWREDIKLRWHEAPLLIDGNCCQRHRASWVASAMASVASGYRRSTKLNMPSNIFIFNPLSTCREGTVVRSLFTASQSPRAMALSRDKSAAPAEAANADRTDHSESSFAYWIHLHSHSSMSSSSPGPPLVESFMASALFMDSSAHSAFCPDASDDAESMACSTTDCARSHLPYVSRESAKSVALLAEQDLMIARI